MLRVIIDDEADFVIVGTGAGGATAARVLAAAGHSVVMLESGPNLRKEDRPRELLPAMRNTFRHLGTTLADGPMPIPVLQGRLVGGGTAINSAIIWRLPDHVVADWRERFGVSDLVEDTALERAFDTIEKELRIGPTARNVLGGNSLALEAGSRALGYEGHPTQRNAPGCQGSGMCLQGCPTEGRTSMDVSYVPRAIADGARLHPLCEVTRVLTRGGRAIGVVGEVLDEETRRPRGRFEVRARRGVVLSAGAIQTPVILRRSGVGRHAGDHFQAHPGGPVLGRFEEPVGMSFGATQGYQVPCFDRGFKLESLSLPPEMLTARIPGAGAEWQERVAHLDHYAQWAVMVRMDARGRVRPGWQTASIKYQPLASDRERFREGVALAARMMFAAGATEVYPGMAGRPAVLRDVSEVKLIEEGAVAPRDFHFLATHLFGTARAGPDAQTSVVDERLECHDVKGLYAMDASIFPTNIGVNPQHSIMGLVWVAAERLASESRARVAA